jgi:hypothetical protein
MMTLRMASLIRNTCVIIVIKAKVGESAFTSVRAGNLKEFDNSEGIDIEMTIIVYRS